MARTVNDKKVKKVGTGHVIPIKAISGYHFFLYSMEFISGCVVYNNFDKVLYDFDSFILKLHSFVD